MKRQHSLKYRAKMFSWFLTGKRIRMQHLEISFWQTLEDENYHDLLMKISQLQVTCPHTSVSVASFN